MEKGPHADGKQAGVGTSRRCQVRKTPRVEVRAQRHADNQVHGCSETLAQSSALKFSRSVGTLEFGKQGSKCQGKGPTPTQVTKVLSYDTMEAVLFSV